MLIVVSVTCGVNDFGQIINSMAVMSLVVVVDYIADVIDFETGSGTEWSRRLFWPNCTAYIAYWAVLWAAFGHAAKGGTGRASAPVFVYFVVFGTMLTFSSFAFLRGYTLWPEKLTPLLSKLCCCMRPLCRDDCCAGDATYELSSGAPTFPRTEALYAVLSLVAKTQLSWFLFIGVLQDMTTEDNEIKPQTDNDELESSLAVLFATVGLAADRQRALPAVKGARQPADDRFFARCFCRQLTVGFVMAVVVIKYVEDGTPAMRSFDSGLGPRRNLIS